jgi:hypothetical protein
MQPPDLLLGMLTEGHAILLWWSTLAPQPLSTEAHDRLLGPEVSQFLRMLSFFTAVNATRLLWETNTILDAADNLYYYYWRKQ